MENKECYRCGLDKGKDFFYKDKSKKDGLSIYCIECSKSMSRNRRAYFRQRYKDRYYNDESFRNAHKLRNYRWRLANPKKNAAQSLLRYHVKQGHIERGSCVVCGKAAYSCPS